MAETSNSGSRGGAPTPAGPSAHEDLAAAVHETTNALTVIVGWLAHAREAGEDRGAREHALDRASACALSARDLMRRAIGARVPRAPSSAAAEVAARAVDDLAVAARDASVKVRRTGQTSGEACLVDHATTVWQVLVNLLLNALSVSSPGDEVQVDVDGDVEPGRVRFTVTDQGPGIPKEIAADLFAEVVSARPGGAGIGLQHARALALEHGGELALVPSARGARFELSWPVAGATAHGATVRAVRDETTRQARASWRPGDPAREPPAPSGTGKSFAGTRVLLLEDDAAVVDLLELGLEARGAIVHTCREAGAFRQALQAADRYDAILVDLSPLGEAGLDPMLQLARATNPALVAVVISGSVSVQPRRDIVWVRKPFEVRELVTAILQARSARPRSAE